MPQPSPTADDVRQRLVDQYTEIARLTGGLAHEIKNPLSTIRLNMELLGEDLGQSDSPQDRRAMKKIALVQRECQRLQDLLDDFLNFAKVRRLKLEPSDLNLQVKQILDFFRPKAKEAQIDVIDYLTSDLPTVLLDRESFHGALLNLVLNAQQAMPGGGQLVVRTYGTADGVALDLIDTGHGMDENAADACLRRFLFNQERRLGLGAAHGAKNHRGPRRLDRIAKRGGTRDAIHRQAARAGAAARRWNHEPLIPQFLIGPCLKSAKAAAFFPDFAACVTGCQRLIMLLSLATNTTGGIFRGSRQVFVHQRSGQHGTSR